MHPEQNSTDPQPAPTPSPQAYGAAAFSQATQSQPTPPGASSPQPSPQPQQPASRPPRTFWSVVTFPVRWFWGSLSLVGKIRLASLLALFAVAIGGVLISNAHKHASTTTPDSATGSVSVTSPTNLDVVCGATGTAVKDAAVYSPSAKPHYMVLFQQSPYTNDDTYTRIMPVEVISDATLGALVRPQALSKTQLVVCVDRTSQADTGRTCAYQETNLPIYSATYQVTVYEATTHRVVLKKAIASTPLNVNTSEATTDNCPYVTSYDPHNPRIYYPYSASALTDALRQFAQ